MASVAAPPSPALVRAAFQRACRTGDQGALQRALAEDTLGDIGGARTNAALCTACRLGYDGIVATLLDLRGPRAVHAHVESNSPLRAAAEGGHTAVVRLLLALEGARAAYPWYYEDVEHCPLFLATCNGHVEVMRLLLEHGAAADDPDAVHYAQTSALRAAVEYGHLAALELLLETGGERAARALAEDSYPFTSACVYGNTSIVRRLLQIEAPYAIDVHANQEEAFLQACDNNHAGVVRELLALTGPRAIDIHKWGVDALKVACAFFSVDVVRALLDLDDRRGMRWHLVAELAATRGKGHIQDMLLEWLAVRAPSPAAYAALAHALELPEQQAARAVWAALRWASRSPAVLARAAGRRRRRRGPSRQRPPEGVTGHAAQ